MGHTGPFQGPLFIVGMPRSGTKLLRDLMNRHPAVGIPHAETELLPRWAERWPSYGDLSRPDAFRAFFAAHQGSAFFTYMAEERGVVVHPADWHAACVDFSLAGVFEALVRQTAAVPAGGVWGDKSPGYITAIPLIRRIWPQARVLNIVRDCRDQVLSIQKAWDKDPLRAAQRWADDVGAALDAEAAADGAVLRLHYEDLLADPEATMRRALGHVGLPWDPACLTLDRPSENLGAAAGASRIVTSNTQKWRTQMDPALRARVESLAGRTLARAGYPVEREGAERLSLAERRLAQLRDGVNLVRFDAAERGWLGAARFRWRLFRDSGAVER
jgi:hypothetical protein